MSSRDGRFNRTVDRLFRANADRGMAKQLDYDSATTAVVVVDAVNDLLATEGKGVSSGLVAQPTAPARRTMAALIARAAAAGWTVIFTTPRLAPVGAHPNPYQRFASEHGLFEAGSWGAEIADELIGPDQPHRTVAHTGISSFIGSGLEEILNELGIDRVVIAGALTDITIDSTARDAAELGFHTTVIADACVGTTEANHRATTVTTLPRMVHAVLAAEELAEHD